MSKLISVAQASEMLGVTIKTLKIWTNENKIKSYRTAGGHRRFRAYDIEKFLGDTFESTKNNKDVLVYCSVSTNKQVDSGNLKIQKEKLEHNEDMVADFISVITCFSARLYGSRGGEKVKKVITELETQRGENNENDNKSNVN